MNSGEYVLTYMDEFIDSLLTKNMVCDVILPRLPVRSVLEASGHLNPRESPLDIDLGSDDTDLASNIEPIRSPSSSIGDSSH